MIAALAYVTAALAMVAVVILASIMGRLARPPRPEVATLPVPRPRGRNGHLMEPPFVVKYRGEWKLCTRIESNGSLALRTRRWWEKPIDRLVMGWADRRRR